MKLFNPVGNELNLIAAESVEDLKDIYPYFVKVGCITEIATVTDKDGRKYRVILEEVKTDDTV